MSLSVGDKLGPYEITALLGKGGMGEVYKAQDTRLHRDVAIKVSNAEFSERFAREARAIAALNHPNICHLYDVGPNYLVMEYVDGPDLRGPMDFDDAMSLVQQLIDGIEAAHEKGITHRDLKPANIKVTHDGVVKILDFGLARLDAPSASSSGQLDPENSPTMSMAATAAGTILGTAAYMAPEQAKGKTADRRADIWAFGVIVYELLTGKRLFTGESAVEILSAVLHKEPDLSAAPHQVRRLLAWCLEKDRKNRLAHIGDARRVLQEDQSLDREGAGTIAASEPALSRSLLSRFVWPAAAAILGITATALAFLHFREQPPQPVRVRIELPEGVSSSVTEISPDGRLLAITGEFRGKRQLWVRPLDSFAAQLLPGTEGATFPFWSPDNSQIGFFAGNKLKKISIAGGQPVVLAEAANNGRGGTWNRDGVIVFAPTGAGQIYRVSENGGNVVQVTKQDPTKGAHRFPAFLPDGKHFSYSNNSPSPDVRGLYIADLNGNSRRILSDNVSSTVIRYGSRSLALLFVRGLTLFAQPFDLDGMKTVGDFFPVAENVGDSGMTQHGDFSVSESGTLIWGSGNYQRNAQLVWVDRTGKDIAAVANATQVDSASLSNDERQIAVSLETDSSGRASDLWTMDVTRNIPVRMTFRPGMNMAPIWAADG